MQRNISLPIPAYAQNKTEFIGDIIIILKECTWKMRFKMMYRLLRALEIILHLYSTCSMLFIDYNFDSYIMTCII